MQGTRQYADLFETGQYGRLYITSGKHARGKTFHIQVLPEGIEARGNGPNSLGIHEEAVEVFGITGGQPGWTETYGWLHKGPWQEDFQRLVDEKTQTLDKRKAREEKILSDETEREQLREKELLAQYR